MKIVRKCIALLLYAVLLLPGAEYRMTSWLRAIEASTAVVDRTMRRRKSKVENDKLSQYLRSTHSAAESLNPWGAVTHKI